MSAVVLPLAHAGEGATWQALLTLLAIGLLVVVALAVVGVLRLEEPGDLILPLAGTAVLASLSGATSTVLSDWVGWAFPVGIVALLALVLASATSLDLGPTSPLLVAAVAVGALGVVLLQGPIVRAWHPADVGLDSALLDDLTIDVVRPEDGSEVPNPTVELVVEAGGGSLGDGFDTDAPTPADPEELVGLTITVVSLDTGENESVPGQPVEDCTDGCDRATYEVTLPSPGEWTVFVEAKTRDARPFTRADGSSGAPTASLDLALPE